MDAPSIPFENTEAPTKYAGFFGFRVGTCEGLWRSTSDAFEILAVVNRKKGNGHFQAAMQWFEMSCRRDGKKLVLRDIFNLRLLLGLRKLGYTRVPGYWLTYEKTFSTS